MDQTNDILKTKNRNELIQLAKDLLQEKRPDISLHPTDFDIRVWNNRYGSIEVVFRRIIRYVTYPTNAFNYDITVDLKKQEIRFDAEEKPFYTPSKKAIQTIEDLKAKGFLPKTNVPDIEYTITENAAYYLISCFDNLYQIDKSTITNKEHPYLSKTLINKKTGERLFFKGNNPFYFLSQITFKHYYEDHLYAILKEEHLSDTNAAIIKIATAILKEKHPEITLDPKAFEIVILGNYKDLIVKYRRYIRFNNTNKDIAFDLAVNIITKEVAPFTTPEIPFYEGTLSDLKAINTIEHITPFDYHSNIEYTVSENDAYFFVTNISENSTKKYFINKNTNTVIWNSQSYTLQMNNREDLSLQEHYKRMTYLFDVKSENNTPLINMASTILKEKQFIPNIKLDDYHITSKASKNEVNVTLTRVIKFIPLRHKNRAPLDYNLKVNLVEKTVDQKPDNFYFPTPEDTNMTKLVETQLANHLGTTEDIDYPIEIIENDAFFSIKLSGSFNLKTLTKKQYRMDKKTKLIKEIISPVNPIYPSPASRPFPRKEIKE